MAGWTRSSRHSGRVQRPGWSGPAADESGLVQEAGGAVFADGSAWNLGRGANPRDPLFATVRPVDYCSAAALATSRALFAEIGGFDPRFEPASSRTRTTASASALAGSRSTCSRGPRSSTWRGAQPASTRTPASNATSASTGAPSPRSGRQSSLDIQGVPQAPRARPSGGLRPGPDSGAGARSSCRHPPLSTDREAAHGEWPA